MRRILSLALFVAALAILQRPAHTDGKVVANRVSDREGVAVQSPKPGPVTSATPARPVLIAVGEASSPLPVRTSGLDPDG